MNQVAENVIHTNAPVRQVAKTSIEPLAPHDVMKAVALGRMFHSESPTFREHPYDDDSVLETLARAMYAKDYYLRGAYHGTTLTGGMLGFITPMYFNRNVLQARDMAIFVVPDKRGSSAAFKLIRDFEQWAIEKGAAEIVLGQTTGIAPKRTMKLFEKLGYRQTGTVHRKLTK